MSEDKPQQHRPLRIDWKKDEAIPEDKDDVVEFDSDPEKHTDIAQNVESQRVKILDEDKGKDKDSKETGDAGIEDSITSRGSEMLKDHPRAMPGGLRGGTAYLDDALHRGGAKDKERGQVDDPSDEHEDEEFIKSFMEELDMIKEYYDSVHE